MPSTVPLSFNELVAESIAKNGNVPLDDIIILDNSDKYRPGGIESNLIEEEDKSLAAIFDTMAVINQQALEDRALCRAAKGSPGFSFRGALDSTVSELIQLAGNRSVRYVELGPEPWKSKAILQQMVDSGMKLQQYVGIDINPRSEGVMREALEPIIGSDRFSYWISDFHQCTVDTFPSPAASFERQEQPLTIVMNLGFQEGNDLPGRLGPMLSQLTRPGDYVLSEMQVLTSDGSEIIDQFYNHSQMRRFSAIVGQKFDGSVCTDLGKSVNDRHEYVFRLVPVNSEVGPVMVATTLFGVSLDSKRRYVLTNSCIKYTNDQFKQAREGCGEFRVQKATETGDRSVVFQIAERV